MEPQDNLNHLEEKYKAQISEMKARFVAEKEELTTLFLDKLKEVENYHKKMLQELVHKSSSDLDAIQAKHEEKIIFLTTLHSREVEALKCKVEELLSDKEELQCLLTAIHDGKTVPKEKIQSYLTNSRKSD